MNRKEKGFAAPDQRWQFWIDVGGTFTDCFVKLPDGRLQRHKLLSSGVTKGTISSPSNDKRIVDIARKKDPDGFWVGYRCCLLGERGKPIHETRIVSFDASTGTLELEQPVSDMQPVAAYTLSSGEEAPVIAIRYLLELKLDDPIPPVAVRLGTTRGTNALITRTGAKTAFVTTRGFGDVLKIGYQNRPDLFKLAIHKATPLYGAVVEIDERITVNGEVVVAADEGSIRQQLTELRDRGFESIAICLLHSYAHSVHEQLIGQIAREVGFDEISISSLIAPLIKIVARGDTTVVDAEDWFVGGIK